MPKALFVGGCEALYHQLELAEASVRAALTWAGLDVDAAGIYHPEGVEPVGDYHALSADNLSSYDAVVLFTTGGAQGADVPALLSSRAKIIRYFA